VFIYILFNEHDPEVLITKTKSWETQDSVMKMRIAAEDSM